MKKLVMFIILASLILVSCTSQTTQETGAPQVGSELTPYRTATLVPTFTTTPVSAPTITLAPTITPTPWVYEVKANDTLFIIAYRNGLTLKELEAANPDVNAYNLAIGMKLNIPASQGKQSTQTVPTPTPAPLAVQSPRCVPSITGGMYCFALVENNQDADLENLTAEFHLTDPATGNAVSQEAQFPLSRLRTGSALPFYAYFAPPVFENPQASLQVLTATTATTSGADYLPLTVADVQVTISADGLSAVVTGSAKLEVEGGTAGKMIFAAAAYDASGQVLGIRRVEIKTQLKSGESYPVSLTVYSTGGKIAKADVYGEGLP